MDTLKLDDLIRRIQIVVGWGGLSAVVVASHKTIRHPEYAKTIIRAVNDLGELGVVCQSLKLPMTGIAIKHAISDLKVIHAVITKQDQPQTYVDGNTVSETLGQVIETLANEASLRLYFYLPEASRELYGNIQPFGPAVAEVFPAAADDIEEAAKCLALERATASVFHALRAMEFGLRALIGDSFADPRFLEDVETWGSIANRIGREAGKRDEALQRSWRGKQDRLHKLAMLVRQFADAFRNQTMHCKSIYTVEQAKDVFQSAGAFLRRLAEDIGDDGRPQEPENAEGPRNPGAQAGGLLRDARQGGETQAEITPPKQPREEGLGTSPPPPDAGCTAKRTRSDRTEDA